MRVFLDSMLAADVDSTKLISMIESQEHEGVKSNLQTFVDPVPTRYSMCNSVTGRLSVKQGPKILTSPQEVKSVLRSRHENGSILQLDLSCAEPNFAMFCNGESPMNDLYEFCASEVLEGKVERSTAKLILLSAIYGQSTKNLSSALPAGIIASAVIKKVKSFLAIDSLNDRLKDAWRADNFRNYFGRPLKTDQPRLLISHYLQSSVAEMSVLLFEEFCKEYRADPLFVIHDALVIDASPELAKELLGRKKFRFKFKDQGFPAAITKIS